MVAISSRSMTACNASAVGVSRSASGIAEPPGAFGLHRPEHGDTRIPALLAARRAAWRSRWWRLWLNGPAGQARTIARLAFGSVHRGITLWFASGGHWGALSFRHVTEWRARSVAVEQWPAYARLWTVAPAGHCSTATRCLTQPGAGVMVDEPRPGDLPGGGSGRGVDRGPPIASVAQHGIEDHDQLAHAADHDDLRPLALQPVGEARQNRIAPPDRQSRHVEHIAHDFAAAVNCPCAGSLATVVIEGRGPDQRGDGLSGQPAQLGQQTDQRMRQYRPDAGTVRSRRAISPQPGWLAIKAASLASCLPGRVQTRCGGPERPCARPGRAGVPACYRNLQSSPKSGGGSPSGQSTDRASGPVSGISSIILATTRRCYGHRPGRFSPAVPWPGRTGAPGGD